MDEERWATCQHLDPMLNWLHDEGNSPRKLRLFACACCRMAWYLLFDERSRRAVEMAEAFADGEVTESQLMQAHLDAREAAHRLLSATLGFLPPATEPPASYFPDDQPRGYGVESVAFGAAETAIIRGPDRPRYFSVLSGNQELSFDFFYRHTPYTFVVASLSSLFGVSEDDFKDMEAARAEQPLFLRCIFGNPFRPATFDPSWRSETAVALATGIYAERAFDRLPILADALEEAGCDQPDLLDHCRGAGPHARGCWVVDAVLGKG